MAKAAQRIAAAEAAGLARSGMWLDDAAALAVWTGGAVCPFDQIREQ